MQRKPADALTTMVSSVDPYLDDFHLKRKRAQTHFETLRDSVQASSTEADTTVGEYDSEQGRYVFRPRADSGDSEWAVTLGDVVYNARAALDYLITALVRSNGGDQEHRGEFPILGGKILDSGTKRWLAIDKWWDEDPDGEIKRKLANTPSATKDALKPLQPFYGVPQTNPALHPLFHLQLLSNRDKHRRLNLLAHVANIEFVDRSGKPLYGQEGHRVKVPEPDADGCYTVSLMKVKEDHREISLSTKATIYLDEPPELVGELLGTVTRILDYLDSAVVPTIKRLL